MQQTCTVAGKPHVQGTAAELLLLLLFETFYFYLQLVYNEKIVFLR